MARPIVETYQTKPDDFQPTAEQIHALNICRLADKEVGDPKMEKLIAEAKASVTDECRDLAEQCKRLRKRAAYSSKGFCWHARIVDARSGETLHDSSVAWQTRDHADRCGQRLIRRFKKTGSWDKRFRVTAGAGD